MSHPAAIIFLTGFLITGALAWRSCPPSWSEHDRNCYRVFEDPLTFSEAEAACNEYVIRNCQGTVVSVSHLASIHSNEENEFLYNLVGTVIPPDPDDGWEPQLYIGMKIGEDNTQMSWTDRSEVDFTLWHNTEPNNAPDSQGVISAGTYLEGDWADAYDYARSYICKLPCIWYHDLPF